MSDLPQRFDRGQLERILQRAAELQAAGADVGDGLSRDEIVALGKEVGIPEAQLRQAMLEELSRPAETPPRGLLDTWFGSATHATRRVVKGSVAEVEQKLLRWMEEQEILVVQRHTSGFIAWEPLGGWQAALRRSSRTMRAGAQAVTLDRATSVQATITQLEPGYCQVTLTADLSRLRGSFIGGGLGLLTSLTGASAIMAVLGAYWLAPAALLVAGAVGAVGIARQFRPAGDRAAIGLERALDHLERTGGEALPPPPPQGLLGAIARELGRAIQG